MIIINNKIKVFLRTVYISSVILFCLFLAFFGTAKAYQNIRLIGFGEYRSAIEIEEGQLKIFDFELSFQN